MDPAGGPVGGGGAEEERKLVETFCGITSASPEEARFFLESHNWQIDAAVHSFFENADADASPPSHRPPSSAATDHRNRHPRPELEDDDVEVEDDDDDDEDYVPPGDEASQLARASARVTAPVPSSAAAMGSRDRKSSKPSGSRPAGGIRTLADLNRRPGPDSDSEDSDGPQEYYTGGEKSGMLVQDPSKGNHDVDAIFEQARQMGATQGPVEHLRPSSSSRSFTGTGRLLSGETIQAAPQQPENVVHDVVFWTNGFTINDGPLRRFDDPENAAFLESIRKSECPKELEPSDKRAAVHVSLTRREEKRPEPVKRHSPFNGVGRTLGTIGSSTGPASPGPAAAAAAAAATTLLSAPLPSAGLSVDASLPSTSIQLRLADGTRMVARFNNHHTVGDVRAFIDASRPGATRSYHLQTVGFPPKQLTDVTQTIEQAGLANSVVIQRL